MDRVSVADGISPNAISTKLVIVFATEPHYLLPILPFLLVAMISSLAADRGWWRNGRLTILWSLVAFLALARLFWVNLFEFTGYSASYLRSNRPRSNQRCHNS